MRAKEDPGEFFNFHPPLVMDPTDMQRLYFASTRVWRTTDGATTWNPISPHFGVDASFAVQALGVTTSQDVVYAGTNNGRLELTTNATAESPAWTETQQNGLPNRIVTEIETMPGDPGTAYVTASGFDPAGGTGHVFKTTDYGAHWSNISANLPNAPANAIEIDWRTSPATLYVATDVGVFWSQNGGLSWNNTSVGAAVADGRRRHARPGCGQAAGRHTRPRDVPRPRASASYDKDARRHEERTRRWDGYERPRRDRLRPDLCLRLRRGHGCHPDGCAGERLGVLRLERGLCGHGHRVS